MRRSFALFVPIALVVAACGAGASDSSSVAAPTSAAPEPAATAAATPAATTAATGVKLVKVGSFEQPLYAVGAPGDKDRLFVVEKPGRIRVQHGGSASTFLDIRGKVTSDGGEQGLLSMAFPPDYAASGKFYVYYTDRSQKQVVAEFRRKTADTADAGSERILLRMSDPEPNHNGGQLQFGPDRLLYIGTGDGGGGGDQHGPRGNAQNLSSLLGKILRIDPARTSGRAYSIPRGNPFRTRSGARPEIYAYGLRNPWRFSFDRSTGDLAIGDVGQSEVEEIDFARRGKARGANYGWRVWEGRSRYTPGQSAPKAKFPVITHNHSADWCSITGGYIVRDPALPQLRGRYVYGDYCGGRVWTAKLSSGRATGDKRLDLGRVGPISSFGQDTAGRVYVVSLEGPVYRLASR